MVIPANGVNVGTNGCSVTRTLAYISRSFTPILIAVPMCVVAAIIIFELPFHWTLKSNERPMSSERKPTNDTRDI